MITIKMVSWCDEEDFMSRVLIKWLSKELDFLDWEAEDNNLWRNFSDCFSVFNLLKEAYELWKSWVDVQFEEIEDNDIFSDNY